MDRHTLLETLADRSHYPRHAIDYCSRNPDHTAAIFLPILNRARNWRRTDGLELDALYYGVHLLALNRTLEARDPLIDLVETSPDAVDRILGERAIGTTFPRVLMALAVGESERLWRYVVKARLDFLIRDAFLRAWTFEVMEDRVSRVAAIRSLSALVDAPDRPDPDDPFWNGWFTAIADLGYQELLPVARRAIDIGTIKTGGFSFTEADFKAFELGLQETIGSENRPALQVSRGYVPFGEGQYDRSDIVVAAPGSGQDDAAL